RAVKQEKKILRVRIVGIPAEEEKLRVARSCLFLETVPVGRADFKLDGQLFELFSIPVEPRLGAGTAAGGVEIKHERFAGLRIAALRITRFREQLARRLDRLAFRLPIDPIVDKGIDACLAFLEAENAGRNRPLSRNAAPVEENADELLPIH